VIGISKSDEVAGRAEEVLARVGVVYETMLTVVGAPEEKVSASSSRVPVVVAVEESTVLRKVEVRVMAVLLDE